MITEWLLRTWSKITQPSSGGLIRPGDWRVTCPDGKRTRWMSYGDARELRAIYGGEMEWRSDAERAYDQRPKSYFQNHVAAWMGKCFDHLLYRDMTERGDRLLEEVLELLQSKGYPRERIKVLEEYVYNRPIGDPAQEVGGVMVTLAGFCHVAHLDMYADGWREFDRINTPEVMKNIRAKQAKKNAIHFDTPLPGDGAMHSA